MHQARSRVLLRAEALIAGRRLALMDVAHSWPGAERMRALLKAFDRLLSNRQLHAERERVYADMAHWLLRNEQSILSSKCLFLDLIEDFSQGKCCVEDGFPQRRYGLRMQRFFTANRDHIPIGYDRPDQVVELIDLIDGDPECEAILRHGMPLRQ